MEWFLLAYIVGTGFGLWVGYNKGMSDGVSIGVTSSVENLIDNGYLKTKRLANGEMEILRHDEDVDNIHELQGRD